MAETSENRLFYDPEDRIKIAKMFEQINIPKSVPKYQGGPLVSAASVIQIYLTSDMRDLIVHVLRGHPDKPPMLPCPVCGGEAIHAIDTVRRTCISRDKP